MNEAPITSGPVLVVGFALSGQSVARELSGQGLVVVAVDDNDSADVVEAARSMDIAFRPCPPVGELEGFVSGFSMAVVSPGIPSHHRIFAACTKAGTPVTTEIEIASLILDPAKRLIAITGTNGKTTVTTLVVDMLAASGTVAVAAGNVGVPLIEAVRGPAEVFVVETSSFQLALTDRFHPCISAWLNLSEDHLDSHGSMDAYGAAKAKIWANQTRDDIAIVNGEDASVMSYAAASPAHVVTFGLRSGDYAISGDAGSEVLQMPDRRSIVAVAELARRYPHDLANCLAACAIAISAGADLESCAQVLKDFQGLHHRVELIVDAGGVRFIDDSKSTTPASTLAAVSGLESVVLIAGGRNKGLNLGLLAKCVPTVHAVVAIGEASEEIRDAFTDKCPVSVAVSMDSAVDQAMAFSNRGDSILLSPACSSFDWYKSYAERGDDFARAARSAAQQLTEAHG